MANRKAQTQGPVSGQIGRYAAWLAPIAALAVYANALSGGFVYDDGPVVQGSDRLRHVADWPRIWTTDYWLPPEGLRDPHRDLLYRPLTLQSYALNYWFFDERPWHFHLVNVLLFAAVCAGVWRLGAVWLGDATAATLGATLFAVHPIHTEAVAGVIGRAELLSALFMLAALLLWHADKLRPSVPKAAGAAICAMAALLAKETALTLPAVTLIADAWCRRKSGTPRGPYWRSRALRAYVPLVAAIALYAAMRGYACGGVFASGTVTALQNPLVSADLAERVWTPFKLLGMYLWLFVWPDRLCADYSLGALPPVHTPWTPPALGGAAAVVMGAIAVRRSLRGPGAAACLIGLFVAGYAIIANGPALIGTIFAERLFFWPSVPLCLLVGLAGSRAWRAIRKAGSANPTFIRVGVVCLLGGLGVRSAVRNLDWASNDTLFAAAHQVNPRSAKVLYAYARTQLAAKRPGQAAELLERATEIWAGHRDMWFWLALSYRAAGKLDDSLGAIRAAELLRVPSRHLRALCANIRLSREGKPALAEQIPQAEARCRAHPDDGAARYRLGNLLLDAGRPADAVEHLQAAYESGVDRDAVGLRLADALRQCGEFAGAAELLRISIRRAPDSWEPHALLARCLPHLPGGEAEAVREVATATALAPRHVAARIAAAEVFTDLGRPAEAIEAYKILAELLPDRRPRRVVRYHIARLGREVGH